MIGEWVEVCLGDHISHQKGFAFKSKDYEKEGRPIVRVSDFTERSIDLSSCNYINHEKASLYESVLIRTRDVIVATVGSWPTNPASVVGKAIQVPLEAHNSLLNQNAVRLRANKGIDQRFLFFLLKTRAYQYFIVSTAQGSASQASITLKSIFNFTFPLPPLPEQKAIAHVLGSLDDRIELNRRMNETLEGMAQALFKSWFVDFDPVLDNAIASGKEIPPELKEKATARSALDDKRHPLPKEIRTLFPNEFTYSDELGWIPKGWEVKTMDMILKSVSETYPLKRVDKVVFLNTGDIQNGQFLHNDFSETTTLPGQAKKSILKDDILYSEIRPKNKRFAYVSFDAPEYVVSTKLMVLRSISDIKSIFAYFILKQKSSIDYLQMMAESRSGTFPQITFDVLSTINIALPDTHSIINYFTENIIERSFNKSIANTNNTKTLTKLRDTLLPKLLSGEIRIPDAEKMVEGIKG